MSNIGIWMLQETGHLTPTLKLAHSLRSRGHRIYYFSILDFEGWVTQQGFEFVPVMESVYPRGALERERSFELIELQVYMAELFEPFSEYLLGDSMDSSLQSVPLDMILCDTLNVYVVMAAHYHRIPCLRLSTSLPQTGGPGIAPLFSSLPFDDTDEGLAAAERAWEQLMEEKSSYDDADRYTELRHALAAKYDYSTEWMNPRATFIVDMHRVPELIMCPAEFDFPRPLDAKKHYIDSLWLSRKETEIAWNELAADKPWVYCTLGSQSHRIDGAKRFFAEVLGAASQMPDMQFVIATGERIARAEFGAAPDNAMMLSYAPQLALLQRSALVITHGGLGTIKEALYYGVPLLVFPYGFDQPGNGARIVHHRLGLVGALATVTAADLVDMCRRVLDDGELRQRVAAMRAVFVELEEQQAGATIVEEYLARCQEASASR